MILGVGSAAGQGFSIGDIQVISSNRVGRTAWDFVIRAAITNNLASAQGISAYVFSSSPTTTPLQNPLGFGDLAAGSSMVSTGSVTIRQDRTFPFNPAALRWVFIVESMPLAVNIISPQGGLLTNGNSLVVTGTVGPAVETVLIGRTPAILDGTNFTATVILEEGRNTISAVATNQYGGAGSANVSFTRDSTPPVLNIETPVSGAVLDTRQITVTGMVNDIVPGTVNPEQVTVMVNGLPAMVANRSYAIPDVLLTPGRNIITVTARDKAGNHSQRQIEVTHVNTASQKRLVRLAGDAQTGMVGSVLPQPLVVELVDGNGIIQTNQPVTFTVARNDGSIFTPPTSGRTLSLLTDYQGQSQVFFQLGTRTGAGNHQVEVSSPGVAAPAYFCANASGSPPARVSALIPETQVGETGKPLPKPWTAFVTDEQGNSVRDVPIVFMVFQGEGRFAGATTVNTNTDSDGRASVVFTLGADEGINNNTVVAIVPGVTNSSATFTASGMKAQAVKDTRISGLVLDHANRPMSNIACRVVGTFNFSFTDAQGQFVISNAPVGAVRLIVDARNRRGHPGEWHYLDFDMVTIAGRDNRLDRPIYMLQLDTDSQAEVGGDKDVTLHLKGIPGSSLTIFANSVRDPNGNPVVTNVTWTQVNAERIPMAPPLGSQPSFTSAIQPANLRFNPPARMCLPNSGASAGQILELFGFDHDIGSFVSVGTATVSADGSQVCSDPGFGVVKSGWHPVVPPPPPCKCWEGSPPVNDACTHWTVIPPTRNCECPRYEPGHAKIKEMTAYAQGDEGPNEYPLEETIVFVGVPKEVKCFDGVEYYWDFGDDKNTGWTNSSVAQHKYEATGRYVARVWIKCVNCSSSAKSDTTEVHIVDRKTLYAVDQDGRRSRLNSSGTKYLEITSNFLDGEEITVYPDPAVPDDVRPPEWSVNDQELGRHKVLKFSASPPPDILVDPLSTLFNHVPKYYRVFCSGPRLGEGQFLTVAAYSEVQQSIELKLPEFDDRKRRLESLLKTIIPTYENRAKENPFKFAFKNKWDECPSSNLAFWTFDLTGTANFVDATGTWPIPGWSIPPILAGYVEGGLFLRLSGSFGVSAVISRDQCGQYIGGGKLEGSIEGGLGFNAFAVGVLDVEGELKTGVSGDAGIFVKQSRVVSDGTLQLKPLTGTVKFQLLMDLIEFSASTDDFRWWRENTQFKLAEWKDVLIYEFNAQ